MFQFPIWKIKAFDVLRGESIRRQAGHYAFVRTVIQWEPHGLDRDCIGIQGTIWYKIKGRCGINKSNIITGCCDLPGMGTLNDNVKAQAKSPFFKNGQMAGHGAKSLEFIFEMDGLYDSIHISMRVKVIKGVQMKAVEAFRRMAPETKYSSGASLGVLKKKNDEPSAARSL